VSLDVRIKSDVSAVSRSYKSSLAGMARCSASRQPRITSESIMYMPNGATWQVILCSRFPRQFHKAYAGYLSSLKVRKSLPSKLYIASRHFEAYNSGLLIGQFGWHGSALI
jgi:hypothetical protein